MFVRWLKSKNVDDGKVTFVEAAFPSSAISSRESRSTRHSPSNRSERV